MSNTPFSQIGGKLGHYCLYNNWPSRPRFQVNILLNSNDAINSQSGLDKRADNTFKGWAEECSCSPWSHWLPQGLRGWVYTHKITNLTESKENIPFIFLHPQLVVNFHFAKVLTLDTTQHFLNKNTKKLYKYRINIGFRETANLTPPLSQHIALSEK